MLSKVLSGAVLGVDGYLVEVEVDVSGGLPAFDIVGLPDTAVRESRERVKSAIKNSGFKFPLTRITANLAPADIKKEGPVFDLPLAVGILAATGKIRTDLLTETLIIGELSLGGGLRPVTGILPIALSAREDGIQRLAVPAENAREASIVDGVEVLAISDLCELASLLNGNASMEQFHAEKEQETGQKNREGECLSDVKGQETAKRALEIAAAGGHNLLLIGPPGAGKTMLARRMPTILPVMTKSEAFEVTKIYSISGDLDSSRALIWKRPFRRPHHTITDAGLIGGGRIPRPGEVSLAHRGVLFLDELSEFRKSTLEALRQPLEEGRVTISRSQITLTYPASFILVASMNPCPCGYYGSSVKKCSCLPHELRKYRNRISGPLWDRIDMHVEMPALNSEQLMKSGGRGEVSDMIQKRVTAARNRQKERYRQLAARTNSELNARYLDHYCRLEEKARLFIKEAVDRLRLSARAYDRIQKLALTIADLEGKSKVDEGSVAEAVQYRSLDREELV